MRFSKFYFSISSIFLSIIRAYVKFDSSFFDFLLISAYILRNTFKFRAIILVNGFPLVCTDLSLS